MSRARGIRAAAVALVLAVPVLAGCDAAQQAQDIGQGVDKAADCAALVGELTGIDWSDVQQAPAQAEEAAQKLDQRLQEVDDADVKAAGEALRDRVRQLADAAGNADAADAQQALADVEAAARRLASACDVNVDQVAAARDPGRGRSHSDAAVGCTVWSTTPAARPTGCPGRPGRGAGAEGLDGPGGVVAAAVEAPVDRLLDPPAGRLEQGGHGQGGPGHHPARRVRPRGRRTAARGPAPGRRRRRPAGR